ncbi:biotin--[acetyl-CoA-carboxylase] ligase [Pedobacter frigiditerrae]|uniref:Biotin--[acetyl-CoA-carboxylase] ligase n=1 Tax=Pedobacter frigiditerrae TaxID=2530452 RepID=A0A4R0N654_9SPHI|nr:biotin--[acetyl-CoA-carboxylase] ligase [Pedobacter frigiditerrae]TCC93744.1 biotin--[acetyl-CoA-carboxylase] ligase [Pedobacter frigiditerrae]
MQNNTFSTLFVGQNLIKLLAVDSTNTFLKNLVSKSEPLPEGTVIMADHQFAGRGQQENTWQAEPGKNLTVSILLKPKFLPLNKQFLLNIAISIAINKALSKYVPVGITIKWPNDIYYLNKKLGGILIENSIVGNAIKTAVIGIGLNINQQDFSNELASKATSLHQILQEDVNLAELLSEICSQIESLYLQLKTGAHAFLTEAYVHKLYKINIPSMYRHNGEIFEGIILGITDLGLLNVMRDEKVTQFNFKEIEFLNP